MSSATATAGAIAPTAVAAAQDWIGGWGAEVEQGAVDYLIGATAERHEAALATRNVRHFPRFAELRPPWPLDA